jgi:hypothetical protein
MQTAIRHAGNVIGYILASMGIVYQHVLFVPLYLHLNKHLHVAMLFSCPHADGWDERCASRRYLHAQYIGKIQYLGAQQTVGTFLDYQGLMPSILSQTATNTFEMPANHASKPQMIELSAHVCVNIASTESGLRGRGAGKGLFCAAHIHGSPVSGKNVRAANAPDHACGNGASESSLLLEIYRLRGDLQYVPPTAQMVSNEVSPPG